MTPVGSKDKQKLHLFTLCTALALTWALLPAKAFAEDNSSTLQAQDTAVEAPANMPANSDANSTPVVEQSVPQETPAVTPANVSPDSTSPSESTPAPTPTVAPQEPTADGNTPGVAEPTPDASVSDPASSTETEPTTPTEPESQTTDGQEQAPSQTESPDETSKPADSAAETTDPTGASSAEQPATVGLAQSADGQTFFLESGKSNPQVIDAAGGKTTNGTNVQLYAYNKSLAQQWKFIASGRYDKSGNPYYFIANAKNTNMVLDVAGGKASNGANVRLWRKNNSDAQLWAINVVNEGLNYASIVSKLSEKAGKTLVLDLAGGKTANKTNLQIYTQKSAKDKNSSAQRFYLVNAKPKVDAGVELPEGDGVYSLRLNSSTGFSTDIKSGSKSNGGNVQLWSYNGSDAQRLIFRYDGKGFYTIGVMGSAKVFDMAGGKLMPGTNIQQWNSNGSDAQKWALRKNANGSYTLVNKGTGLVFDLAGGNVAKGTNILGNRAVGGSRQQFKLVKDTREVIPEGIVTISPFTNTSMVFDIKGGSTTSGGGLQLWTSNGSIAQRFEVVKVSEDTYRIRTAASGGWLTGNGVSQQVTQQGTGANESTADLWKLVWDTGGYFSLQNVTSRENLVLHASAVKKGAEVQSATGKGSALQHFVFKKADLIKEGVYYIRSFHGTNLDVADASVKPGNIQTFTAKTTTDAQRFQLTKSGSGYKIVNLKSGLPVSVSNLDDYGNVAQKRDKGTSLQLWKPAIGDGGYLKFVNAASGMVLATRGGGSGVNVVQRNEGAAAKSECWKLVATSGTVKHPAQAKTRVLMIGNSLTYRINSAGNNNLPSAVQDLLKSRGIDSSAEVVYVSAPGQSLQCHLGKDIGVVGVKCSLAATKLLEGFMPDATQDKRYLTKDKNDNIVYKTFDINWNTSVNTYGSGDWDYVIIQDRSDIPVADSSAYVDNVKEMSRLVRLNGSTPILYGTWSYSDKDPSTDGKTESDAGRELLKSVNCTSRDDMDTKLQNAYSKVLSNNDSATAVAALADVRSMFASYKKYWKLFIEDCKHPSVAGYKLAAQVIADTLQGLIG